MNPFDYVMAINLSKKDLMVDDLTEKGYAPYMVNRSLSTSLTRLLLLMP